MVAWMPKCSLYQVFNVAIEAVGLVVSNVTVQVSVDVLPALSVTVIVIVFEPSAIELAEVKLKLTGIVVDGPSITVLPHFNV